MDIYEELVMRYLCDGKSSVFVCPNFRVTGGWSFPDFVVLDFKKGARKEKVVSVVEVTTNKNPLRLIEKVEKRNIQWLVKLKEQLHRSQVVDDSWKYMVEVFVREDAAKKFHEKFDGQTDVKIHILDEKVLNCWKWDWTERE